MSAPNIETGCCLISDVVEPNQVPTQDVPSGGEPVYVRPAGLFLERHRPEANTAFTVLLRDNRVVTVRGSGLLFLQNPTNPTDLGSYAILDRLGGEERTVALFRVAEVTGIFSGELSLGAT